MLSAGLSGAHTTKEAWLRSSAECRVRGYLGQLQRLLREEVRAEGIEAGCVLRQCQWRIFLFPARLSPAMG